MADALLKTLTYLLGTIAVVRAVHGYWASRGKARPRRVANLATVLVIVTAAVALTLI